MATLKGLAGTALPWRKPVKRDKTWKLVHGGDTLATLRREKTFGTLATGEAGGKRWTFKRCGFFRPRVTIRPEGSETSVAEFVPRWTGGGELTLADGRRFEWKQKSFWRQEWAFTEGEADEVLRYRCGFSMSKSVVTVSPSGARLRELSLLTLLGWYLIMLSAEDAGTAAAAGAASAAAAG